MPNSLRSVLSDLASTFANGVLAAIRTASVQDLLAESGGAPRRGPGRPRERVAGGGGGGQPDPLRGARRKNGRLARRSPEDIALTLGKVVALLRGKKSGLRSEEIQKALKLDKRELPRVLHAGLRARKLKSKGQKRATVYSAR